jgi:hypothetical protein
MGRLLRIGGLRWRGLGESSYCLSFLLLFPLTFTFTFTFSPYSFPFKLLLLHSWETEN